VGQGENLSVYSKSLTIKPGDRLLLCTDGLDKVISSEAIKKELAGKQSPEEACRKLMQMANDNGGPDNITVIVIHTLRNQ
jgi:protein phosphatase